MKEISVEELLPVSQDNRIKVKIEDVQPEIDESTNEDEGKAVWTVKVNPGEEKELTFADRIEYPSRMQLVGL